MRGRGRSAARRCWGRAGACAGRSPHLGARAAAQPPAPIRSWGSRGPSAASAAEDGGVPALSSPGGMRSLCLRLGWQGAGQSWGAALRGSLGWLKRRGNGRVFPGGGGEPCPGSEQPQEPRTGRAAPQRSLLGRCGLQAGCELLSAVAAKKVTASRAAGGRALPLG